MAEARHFVQTWKELKEVEEQLKCVICGTVPPKLYSTIHCEHKYCERCSVRVNVHKLCLVCDVRVKMGEMKIDKFFSEMIPKVQLFGEMLEKKEAEIRKSI